MRLEIRNCPCGSGKPRMELKDARGISCGYACIECVDRKRAAYRPEVFTDPNYWADEPVDGDGW